MVPTVLDQTSRGDRAYDLYSLLLRERIVFLGQEVDDQIANLIVAQILYLEADDPEKDISLYINSPGGLGYAGMAIYDVMQHVRPEVSTICVGMGMSAAAMILAGGAAGKRLALPNAKIMIHQGSAGARGAPSGHGDPAARGTGDDQADGRDHRVPQRPQHRGGRARHRQGLLHDGAGGARVRTDRRDHHSSPWGRGHGPGAGRGDCGGA